MNKSTNLEKTILDLVHRDDYKPQKIRSIAKQLKLLDEEKNLKRTVKRLIKQDRLAYGPKHLIIAPKPRSQSSRAGKTTRTSERSNEVIGTFRRASAGFGFVTPKDSTATDRSDDIFIPKQKTLDAADLDLVRIRISRGHQGRRREGSRGISGRVVQVIDRHTNQFVGTYGEQDGTGFVVVDGGVFESGVLVGDAGAKNCKTGDKVVIEMVHFPSNREDGEGVIVEVLGDRGKPGVDTLSIIRQFDLPEEFPENVLENAREQAEAFDDEIIPDRRKDFTGDTVVTIDPKTARDFDDAISLKKLKNGHWELGVHIADVSHFVPYRSQLDNEAYQRGTSVYLPDRVIPMLPEIISNNLASLQPDRIRYCMTAVIEFSGDGVPIHTDLHRGAIKSVHRFNYEEIDDYLADDRPWKKKLTPQVFELVRDMHTLAMRLRKRRMDSGSINLVLPEVKIDLDDDGKVAGAHTVENTESHQVIEEFMLAANEAVARRLADENLYFLRRVHPQPTEAKLNDLNDFVKGLGIEVENLQNRFELKRVIEESEDMPEQHAIHYAVLRSMQKAIYSPEEVGHYALNSDYYCHFTSPIRRYPDLVIHRMVGDLIDGKKPDANYDRLAMLGKRCSELEKRATEAERELKKLKLLNFMSDKVGQWMHAVITGVEAFGIFCEGIEIPAEGLVPVANLPQDRYQYDRPTRVLSGHQQDNQFRLGDEIEVRVTLVDPDRRLLEFSLLAEDGSNKSKKDRQYSKGSGASAKRQKPKQKPKQKPNQKPKQKTKQQHSSDSSSKKSTSKKAANKKFKSSKTSAKKSSTKSSGRKSQRAADTDSSSDDWESRRASGRQKGQRRKKKPYQAASKKQTASKPGRSPKKPSKASASKQSKKKSNKQTDSQASSKSRSKKSKSKPKQGAKSSKKRTKRK